jgi:hypothetical protein
VERVGIDTLLGQSVTLDSILAFIAGREEISGAEEKIRMATFSKSKHSCALLQQTPSQSIRAY